MRKKRFSGDSESVAKEILGQARSRNEAAKLLQKEGFSTSDASKLVQRYYRSSKKGRAPEPPKKVMSPKEVQLELTTFTQNIHMLNEELHKNLRRNKFGVRHEKVEPLHPEYKRPPGFTLVPGLLGIVPGREVDPQRIRSRKSSREKGSEDNMKGLVKESLIGIN